MSVENIGSFIDRATSKIYQVQKRTEAVNFSSLAGPAARLKGGSEDFITTCGVNLNPKSDDDSVFEMIEIDGTLHRLE